MSGAELGKAQPGLGLRILLFGGLVKVKMFCLQSHHTLISYSSFTFTRVSSWSRQCVVWSTQSSGARAQIPLLLRSFNKSFHICNQPAPPLSKWITLISYWGQIWAKLVKMNNTHISFWGQIGSKKMHQMTWQVTLTRQEWEKLSKCQRNRKK